MIVISVFRIQGQGGGCERAVPPRAAAGERVQHPDREDVITRVFSELKGTNIGRGRAQKHVSLELRCANYPELPES